MAKYFYLIRQCCVFILLAIAACTTFASDFSVEVIDQHGHVVHNAVIVNPSSSISTISPVPAVMDQVDKAFLPLVLAVEEGRQVSFPNSDNIRHHVYSFSEPKRFEIKLYANKPKDPIEFDNSGVVVLGCNIHDSMIGYIFVSKWQDFRVTDSTGRVTFKQQSALPERILVWHPWANELTQPQPVDIKEWPESGELQVTLNIIEPKRKSTFKRYRK